MQTLRDELQKFLQDHQEFENWLERSEKELENMRKGGSSPEALPALLKRQGSFSEDVISHKGDLRFVTISGQKVLDTENSLEKGKEPSATGTLVKDKLKDATERYTALHSECARLGAHLNTLLGQYQQFQSSADSLQAWMKACEASVEKLLSDTIASDPGVLQQQLATTKQLQEELAEHEVPVEKLQKVAHDLMEIEGSQPQIASMFKKLQIPCSAISKASPADWLSALLSCRRQLPSLRACRKAWTACCSPSGKLKTTWKRSRWHLCHQESSRKPWPLT